MYNDFKLENLKQLDILIMISRINYVYANAHKNLKIKHDIAIRALRKKHYSDQISKLNNKFMTT